jgi:DMSO/TMAO reductase YedYZ molybdopterin-dependent catalytic subunit
MESEKQIEQKIRRRQFLSFAAFAGLNATAIGAWTMFRKSPLTDNQLSPFTRGILNTNEKLNNKLFSSSHLAPTYPISKAAQNPRANGDVGLKKEGFEVANWRLQVQSAHSEQTALQITLDDIKKLPKTEICFDFKCIEGWNEIVHYGGVRLSDFLKHYQLGTRIDKINSDNLNDWYNYIGMTTPDDKYYVGLDMKSALHPQTMLCYELNNKPLPEDHGAPLRLIIPVKYGVKNLKRIGIISFSDAPPKDYWYERGYIYDAAL